MTKEQRTEANKKVKERRKKTIIKEKFEEYRQRSHEHKEKTDEQLLELIRAEGTESREKNQKERAERKAKKAAEKNIEKEKNSRD